jgi:hypothetical protein
MHTGALHGHPPRHGAFSAPGKLWPVWIPSLRAIEALRPPTSVRCASAPTLARSTEAAKRRCAGRCGRSRPERGLPWTEARHAEREGWTQHRRRTAGHGTDSGVWLGWRAAVGDGVRGRASTRHCRTARGPQAGRSGSGRTYTAEAVFGAVTSCALTNPHRRPCKKRIHGSYSAAVLRSSWTEHDEVLNDRGVIEHSERAGGRGFGAGGRRPGALHNGHRFPPVHREDGENEAGAAVCCCGAMQVPSEARMRVRDSRRSTLAVWHLWHCGRSHVRAASSTDLVRDWMTQRTRGRPVVSFV